MRLIADINPGPFIDLGDRLVYAGGKAYGVFDDGFPARSCGR